MPSLRWPGTEELEQISKNGFYLLILVFGSLLFLEYFVYSCLNSLFSLKTKMPQLPSAKMITNIKVKMADQSLAWVIGDSNPICPIFVFAQAFFSMLSTFCCEHFKTYSLMPAEKCWLSLLPIKGEIMAEVAIESAYTSFTLSLIWLTVSVSLVTSTSKS